MEIVKSNTDISAFQGTSNDVSTFEERCGKVLIAAYELRKKMSGAEIPKSVIHTFGEIKHKPKINWDEMEYVEEAWMRDQLSQNFLWSWEGCGTQPLQVIPSLAHCVFTGTLSILEGGVIRKYTASGASQIKLRKGTDVDIGNIIRLNNDVSSAVTMALKKAINMLTNIGDPVYGKTMYFSTNSELKKQLEELLNEWKILDITAHESGIEWILNTFGGIDFIPDDSAKQIINNISMHIENKKKENNT